MENEMNRKIGDEVARRIEKRLRGDPKCPSYILAGLDVADAVKDLQHAAFDLIDLTRVFVDAEDEGAIREICQYAKLVTAGIKQYVAAVRNGGAS